MSDVKRYTASEAYAVLPFGSKVISEADYDALLAENATLRADRDAFGQNAMDLKARTERAEAECDQLRAELAAIRGQQPVAWRVPVAGEYEIGADREKVQYQRDMYERIMSDDMEHEEAQPLYALPPQQPDAVSVPMELLERISLSRPFEPVRYQAIDELRALLSTRQAEEGE